MVLRCMGQTFCRRASNWKLSGIFPGGSVGKESACNAGDLGLIPGLGGSPGEGKGYLLQDSGLENPMDCIVCGITESGTTERLSLSLTHFASVPAPPLSCHSLLCCKTPSPALCAFHSDPGTVEITQLWELVSLQIYRFNHRWTFAPSVILPTHMSLQPISDPPSLLHLDSGAD